MNRQQKEDYETLKMIESMIKSISNKELNHDETIKTMGFIRRSIYLISLKNLLAIQEKIDTSFLDNESLNIERKEAIELAMIFVDIIEKMNHLDSLDHAISTVVNHGFIVTDFNGNIILGDD